MESLPFLYTVGGEYPGLIRLERPYVVVEFSKWSWRKMAKQLIEVRIPITEITSVQFITRMLETRLDLKLRTMKAAGEIPCDEPGLVQFQFAQRHREAARELASILSAMVAEQRLEQLERETRRLED